MHVGEILAISGYLDEQPRHGLVLAEITGDGANYQATEPGRSRLQTGQRPPPDPDRPSAIPPPSLSVTVLP